MADIVTHPLSAWWGGLGGLSLLPDFRKGGGGLEKEGKWGRG